MPNQKKTPNTAIIIITIFLFSSCILEEEKDFQHDFQLTLINNSDHNITWYSFPFELNDSSLLEKRPTLTLNQNTIAPGSSSVDLWQQSSVQNQLMKGTIRWFIFVKDSVESIPWSVVRNNHIVAKTVTFKKYEEIHNANFIITYP